MKEREYVVYDLVCVIVEPYEDIASSIYKYYRYGHVSTYCQHEEACRRCGGRHDARGCERGWNCICCERVGIRNRKHGALDRICPVYERALQRERENSTGRSLVRSDPIQAMRRGGMGGDKRGNSE